MKANVYVPRRLFWVDDQQQRQSIGQDELAKQTRPVVVLAEPGAGKSELFRHASALAGAPMVTATKWLRTARPEALITPGLPIFIDGLDEASARKDGDAVERVLEKLNDARSPLFVLSCRSADWEAHALTGIKQDYGVAPLICHLEPFSRAEAEQLLGLLCPHRDPAKLIKRLDTNGLGALVSSPLALQLVAAVVEAWGDLPSSRAGLYAAAVKVLWAEHDLERSDHALTALVEDDALDAAGSICANLLMGGCEAVVMRGPAQAGPGELSIHALASLPGATHVRAILGSKLFRQEEPGRTVAIHRTVAEFLSARWLAHSAQGRSQHRLLARLQPEGSVPARVRGLHAWLPHFSPELGRGAIDCDPFGVIRYGDTEGLPLDMARHLLKSLVDLATHDPFFRASDWASHPLGALMRPELAADIDALIASASVNGHLRALLIEGLRGEALASQLAPTLERIAFGRDRFYRERDDALKALAGHRDLAWFRAAMEKLRQEGTQDATRLAVGVLDRIGPVAAGVDATADVLCADIGLTLCAVPRERDRTHMVRSYHRTVQAVPLDMAPLLLDRLSEYAAMSFGEVSWYEKNDTADIIASLAATILPALPISEAPRVWRWLKPLAKAHSYTRDALKEVEGAMAARTDLRRAVQRHVAFNLRPRTDLAAIIYADLNRTPGVRLAGDDLLTLLDELHSLDRTDPAVRRDWQELTDMLRDPDVLPDHLAKDAAAFCGDDTELLAHLDTVRRPRPPRPPFDWELEHEARANAREAERAARFVKHRDEAQANRDKLRAGDPDEIGCIAQAYLGQFADLRGSTPEERLQDWLGEDLAADALVGLEAVLHRDDLPNLGEVSSSLAKNRPWYVGYAALAGVIQRLRQGKPLADVPDHALLLASLHRRWSWGAEKNDPEAVGKALDDAVADTPARFEAWHRLRIEPQLGGRSTIIDGLHDLTYQPRFPEVAQRLTREWLLTNADLPHEVERELVDALLLTGDYTTATAASVRRLPDVLPDRSAALFWLAVDWITDFDANADKLRGIGQRAPDFLPSVHTRLGLDRHQPARPRLSVGQLEWLIKEFRSSWPLVDRFSDEAEGWGVDAADLIRSLIDRLAGNPSAESGAALDRIASADRDGYTDLLLHAAAEQRQVRSETEFRPISPGELRDLLMDGPPSDIDELRALVLDAVDLAQAKLRGSDTDRVVDFWTDDGRPRDENRCRDRLADLIEAALEHYGIHRIPERDMPRDKRADLAFLCGRMQLPMEIKGQWHNDVWDAASGQLDRLYLRDWRSEDRGIYIVLWFGTVPARSGRRLKPPPKGSAPSTATEMEGMLRD